jgi:hypothetical protein
MPQRWDERGNPIPDSPTPQRWDESGNPVSASFNQPGASPPQADAPGSSVSGGFGSRLWEAANKPLGRDVAEVERQSISDIASKLPERLRGPAAYVGNLATAVPMSIAESARRMFTPLGVATMGAGGAAQTAKEALAAYPGARAGIAAGETALGGLFAGQGVKAAAEGRQPGETGMQEFERRAGGVGQALLGGLPVVHGAMETAGAVRQMRGGGAEPASGLEVAPEELAVDRNVHPNVHLEDAAQKAQKSAAGELPRATVAVHDETGQPVVVEGHDGSAGAEIAGGAINTTVLPGEKTEAEIAAEVAHRHWGKEGKGYPAKMGTEAPPFTGGEQQGQEPYTAVPIPREAFHPESIGEAELPKQAEGQAITERAATSQTVERAAPLGMTETHDLYRNPETGEWHPDREAEVHEPWVQEVTKNIRPSMRPTAHILMGGTSSGKTTASRAIIGETPYAARIDTDEARPPNPEYQQYLQTDPENAAARTHVEAKYMAQRALARAVAMRADVIWDATTSGTTATDFLQRLKAQGYRLHGYLVDAPFGAAMDRAIERARPDNPNAINAGRRVPLEAAVEAHLGAARNFLDINLQRMFDELRGIDTSTGKPETFYERLEAGPENIYNREQYERVRAKAGQTTGGLLRELSPAARQYFAVDLGRILGLQRGGLEGIRPAAGAGAPQAARAGGQPAAARGLAGERVSATGLSPEKGPGTEFRAGVPLNAPRQMAAVYDRFIGTPLWQGMKRLNDAGLQFLHLKGLLRMHGGLEEAYTKPKLQAEAKATLGEFQAQDLGSRLSRGLSQADQQVLGRFIQGDIAENQVRLIRNDPRLQDALDAAKYARHLFDNDLGMRAVVQGLLKDTTFFQNYGKYMPRLYREYELNYDDVAGQVGARKPNRMNLDRFAARKDVPAEVRMLLGEIKEPAYPVAKGVAQLSRSVAQAEFFRQVAQNPEWAGVAPRAGFTKMPETYKLGELSGKWVRADMASDLNEMVKTRSELAKAWGGILNSYKWSKVVAAPKSFVWHSISRMVTNYLGGLPPVRMDIYAKALADTAKQGEWWQRALKAGAHDGVRLNTEVLDSYLDSWNKSSGNVWQRMAKTHADVADKWGRGEWGGAIAKAISPQGGYGDIGGVGSKISDAYRATEQWMKVAKFMHNVEKGMGDFEAAQDARKWTVDYRNVPKAVNFFRRTGIAPFVTYPAKAMPLLLESAVRAPWRLGTIAASIWALERALRGKAGISKEEDEAMRRRSRVGGKPGSGLDQAFLGMHMPGFERYIPVSRDKSGRVEYLDLAHVLHWTGIGGAPQPGVEPMGPIDYRTYLAGNPLVSIGAPMLTGRDPFTGKDLLRGKLRPSLADRAGIGAQRAWRTFAPAGVGDVRNIYRSATGTPSAYGEKPPDLPETLFGAATGLNVRPFEQTSETRRRISEMNEDKRKFTSAVEMIARDQSLTAEEKREQIQALTKELQGVMKQYSEVFRPGASR